MEAQTWKYGDGKVTLTINFGSDLEGKNASANFIFDRLFIPHDPLSLNFTIKSQGMKLTFYEKDGLEKVPIFKSVCVGLSGGALLLLFLASWAHKMVGVEFVHSLQLIYYLHFSFKEYTLMLSSFQSLSLVAANDLYWQTLRQNFRMNQEQGISYSKGQTELTVVILAIPAVLSVLALIGYALVCHCSTEYTKESFLKIVRRVYNGFIFPVTIGSFSPYLLSKASLSTRNSSNSASPYPTELICVLSLLVGAVTSAVLAHELKEGLSPSPTEGESKALKCPSKSYYIPCYIVCWTVQTVLLWLLLQLGFHCFFGVLSVTALSLVLLIFFRPYDRCLDLVGSVFNIVLQLCFLAVLLLRN